MEPKKSDITSAVLLIVRVAAVVVIIVGLANLTRTIIKSTAFSEYPLQTYEITQVNADGKSVELPADQLKTTRKLRMIEDYVGSVTTILVAAGIYLVTRKYSKN